MVKDILRGQQVSLSILLSYQCTRAFVLIYVRRVGSIRKILVFWFFQPQHCEKPTLDSVKKCEQPAVTDEPRGARQTQQVDPGTEPTIWTVTVDYDTRQDLSHSWTSQRSADLQPDLEDESMIDKAVFKSRLVAANVYGVFSSLIIIF